MVDYAKMEQIKEMAEIYAKMYVKDDHMERGLRKELAKQTAVFTAVEMAYFCQQISSWVPQHEISMCLTVLTNQLDRD